MPLAFAEKGTTFSVQRITGRDKTKTFLENLGFVPGSEVTVVSETAGNLIVLIKGCRVAVDQALATRIDIG